ncbi:hypothetical protein [Streptomyces sp. NPDC090036]|uniref:hypothetical protein n=1 Tax=Streptomyces sp. NPDC090036 TaxID=3365926 RepID=UPI003800D096
MSVQLFSALGGPLRVLRLLAVDHPHLPAPCVSVSTVTPDLLELSFHDDLAGFEAWREALGIDPGSVSHRVHAHGGTRVLKAETQFAGAWLHLIGFAKTPASEEERSRAGAAS